MNKAEQKEKKRIADGLAWYAAAFKEVQAIMAQGKRKPAAKHD
jgi:hypothetical protein